MKSDRELLKLAAKAAGIHIDKGKSNGGPTPSTGFDLAGNVVLDWHNGTTWNPLADDGDALRLAVKLRITINQNGEKNVQVHWRDGVTSLYSHVDLTEIDRITATRRAIVLAAAEVGSGMP